MNRSTISAIYKEFHVPKHIIAHMRTVAYVCKCICEKFEARKTKIDKESVINAALLHDTLRVVDFKRIDPMDFKEKPSENDLEYWQKIWKKYHKIGHEKAMAEVLRARNEEVLANLIEKHEFFSVWKLKSWEEKILYYSDKRVDHDKIVSLEIRFSEGKKRNMRPTDDPKFVGATEKKAKELETELIDTLGEEPLKNDEMQGNEENLTELYGSVQ